MLVKHPTQPGWLISTPAIEVLLNSSNMLLEDGSSVHPLYFQNPDFLDDDLDAAKQYAIGYVRKCATEAEQSFDGLLNGGIARMVMLNTEIVTYYEQGRPADPSPSVFVIADAMATRRGITLRDMLEILFNRWRNVQANIATIITELDRLTEAINDAAALAEIQAAVQSASWP